MCTRKSGKVLRKQRDENIKKNKALDARIIKRAESLVKKFPDVQISVNLTTKGIVLQYGINVELALNLIECIEKYNADNSGIIQTEIKF